MNASGNKPPALVINKGTHMRKYDVSAVISCLSRKLSNELRRRLIFYVGDDD